VLFLDAPAPGGGGASGAPGVGGPAAAAARGAVAAVPRAVAAPEWPAWGLVALALALHLWLALSGRLLAAGPAARRILLPGG